MLAAGLCSARRRGRTLGLPADWTLRSRDTDGLTRCPFRLEGSVPVEARDTLGIDEVRQSSWAPGSLMEILPAPGT